MSKVVLASAKGSPGTTTTAFALASWWPRPVIVMEADSAGGDLAARLGMREEPGLVGMAAALRRDPQSQPRFGDSVADHLQRTSAGIQVILAPAGSHQATSALNLLSDISQPPLPDSADLLIDIGRFSTFNATKSGVSPDRRIGGWTDARSSDLFVWICRPCLADLAHLAAALHHQPNLDRKKVIVLCGTGPYPADEVAGTLDIPVLGHLPADPSGTTALWVGGGRAWARSVLGRASKSLVEAIVSLIANADEIAHAERTPSKEATGPDPSTFQRSNGSLI
jgi:hypothetical protein